MDVLKVAVIVPRIPKPVLLANGHKADMVGATGAGTVVKLQVLFSTIDVPTESVTATETVAVYVVELTRFTVGVKVAVLLVSLYDTVPGTAIAPAQRVKLSALIVVGSINVLKVAVTVVVMATPVAAPAGKISVMVGAA
jgi:hypothetical protein